MLLEDEDPGTGPGPVSGRIRITWPSPAPGGQLHSMGVVLEDAETGAEIYSALRLVIDIGTAEAGWDRGALTATLTEYCDAHGQPLRGRDWMPTPRAEYLHDPAYTGPRYRTVTRRYLVAEMHVRTPQHDA